jgi:O-antigen ligase
MVLAIAFVAWVAALQKGQARWRFAGIYWPLVAWIAVSAVSGLLSSDPLYSIAEQGGILTIAVVPMIVSMFDRRRWERLLVLLTVTAALSAIVGLAQFTRGASSLEHRLDGLANHYTTFAGWTLIVTLLLVGDIVFGNDRKRLLWTIPAATICSIALVLGLTRGAWLGLATGIVAAAALARPRTLIFLPMLIMVLVLALPRAVLVRGASTFDLSQQSSSERVGMLRTGLEIAEDNAVFGVGPEMAQTAYPEYRVAGAPQRVPHLHNNVVQIAAERGFLGLGAYFAILTVFFVRAGRQFLNPLASRRAIGGCLLAIIGVTVAGLFEYNWGDAEVWILTLACLATPFAPIATETS